MLGLSSSSFAYQPVVVPSVAPRMASPVMEMTDDKGFAPLNLGAGFNLKYLREAELTHGRICMLAFIGYVTVDLGNTWPGAPKVSSLAAHDAAVQNGSMMALLLTIGLMEP